MWQMPHHKDTGRDKEINRPVFSIRGKNRLGGGGLKERRLTHGCCSGADKPRLRGYGRLGHYATLHSHARLRPHFCAAGTLARSFIAAQKRRKPFCYMQLCRRYFEERVTWL
jgi:hypothetical protein